MTRRRTRTDADRRAIGVALNYLRDARAALRRAGAKNAAAYVSRALKSAEGAQRHAERDTFTHCDTCGAVDPGATGRCGVCTGRNRVPATAYVRRSSRPLDADGVPIERTIPGGFGRASLDDL
jgi:hypothetical protein